jgi:hypothetical protein
MAQDETVHTQFLGDTRYRDLKVTYDKGGINYWNYSTKPKGIYFSSFCYTRSGGFKSWTTGQKGDGYLLAVPLERYSSKQLRLVRERVEAQADAIHAILSVDGGSIAQLQNYISGEADLTGKCLQTAA